MSEISAADVKKLREMTGAGMMDCKSALTEAEGDFEKAIESKSPKSLCPSFLQIWMHSVYCLSME